MCQRKEVVKQKFFALGHKRCHYCCIQLNYASGFKNSATVEHIIPRSQGGTLAQANLLVICKTCNEKRQDKNFRDYVMGCELPRKEWLVSKFVVAQRFYEKNLVK